MNAQSKPSQSSVPQKRGLLVEDASAIEVTHDDGRQSIEKTFDRDSRIAEMQYAAQAARANPTPRVSNPR